MHDLSKPLFPVTSEISQLSYIKGKANTRNWRTLFHFLRTASVADLRYALELEREDRARPQMMRRIITRLNTLERNRLYKLLKIKP